ncbi:MAG TPA: family 20 glycosylhydrolase [Rhodanobacteraceae bacterium]|nr:family 20 glycosylhydrolase [Rhodanobacteraceae bacterium]
MRYLVAAAALCMLVASSVTGAQALFNIVPEPAHLVAGQGAFTFTSHTRIEAPTDARAQWIAHFLADKIAAQTGHVLPVVKAPAFGRITLRIDPAITGDEAYHLDVTPDRIIIAAHDNRGLLWGVQTLRQLLPLQHETPTTIPAVGIQDAPRYPWRGVMLDVARHFYPVAFVKQQIALASYYKLDVFHWHLTDDQGWRIQIKRYPKLTSVGAWRTDADGQRYGGFYTQKEIRDVVDYARQRGVMVVPEIEMPGHSSAAIAAYPELSCNDEKIKVPTTWGVFDHADCVAKDSTYRFLENVLDEVINLFPSPYVHIGGDEVPPGVWANCAACNQLAQEHGLQGEPGLHGYFVNRIRKYLAGRGKMLVGWDEILEGKLNPGAVVEVWRGEDEAKKAFANGNRIILAGPFYLDRPISDMTLEDLYRADPLDQPLYLDHTSQVLGGEAPLWSERATPVNAAAKLYPRLLAIAEHFWNPAAHDWSDFHRRARAQEAWLDARGVAYGPEDRDVVTYRVSFNPTYQRWRIAARRGFDSLRVHYTTDGTVPTVDSPSFGDVLDLYHPATVTVVPFRGDVAYEMPRTFRIVANLALGKPVTYAMPPFGRYAGSLTDGILGGSYDDGAWAGWQNADMDATIDMGQPTPVHSITVPFLQDAQVRVLLPPSVTFEVSNDDQTWTTLESANVKVDPTDTRVESRSVAWTGTAPVTARYIRVVATGYHQPVGTMQPFIFADQIIVK